MTPQELAQAMGTSPQVNPQGQKPVAPKPRKGKRTLGETLFAPAEWLGRSVAWVTSSEKNGGFKFLAYAAAVYSFGLSAEVVYQALPVAASVPIENTRFMPKPGVDDGADIMNLVPDVVSYGVMLANLAGEMLPFWIKIPVNLRWSVWQDPAFYVALAIAALVQGIEAKVWRRVALKQALKQKQREINELNQFKVPDLSPKALMVQKVKAKEMQYAGMKDVAASALTIIATYAAEAYFFSRSMVSLDLPAMTTLIYGLINIFGFELSYNFAQDPEGEEVPQ